MGSYHLKPFRSMDRRNWLKASLGLAASTAFTYSLKADEIKYNRLVHPYTGRWMNDERSFTLPLKARLNSNENPYGPSERAKAAIIDGFKDANRYSRYVSEALKEKIAQYEKVSPDNIFLYAGLSEMLNLFGSLTGMQHGEMISAHPTFDLMPALAGKLGGKWVQIPLNDQYQHDLEAMESSINSNTKLVYICNPGNPCSTMVDPDQLASFINRASRKTVIFIDEAYIDYVADKEKNSMVKKATQLENVFVGKTLSKIHGFAGLRIAYTISSPAFVKEMQQYHAWDFSVSAPAMYGAMATIDDEEFKAYCLRKTIDTREYAVSTLKNMGYEPLPSFTNFIIFPINKPGNEFVQIMADKSIALRSWNFNDKNWARVSIGTKEEIDMFLTAMKEI